MGQNIFSSLAKFADRQEENFLTEALVYLLNFILDQNPSLGRDILRNICGKNCGSWFPMDEFVDIRTQVTNDEGRPDIIIQVGSDKIVFIEIKHDSMLGKKQLERYLADLEKSPFKEKQLVLITRSRHSMQETSLGQEQFQHVCWYEISGWLADSEIDDAVVNYLVRGFLDFMKEKQMSIEKVSWEYMEGVPAMIHLLNMLRTAIAEALPHEKVRKTISSEWMGYYLGDGSDLAIIFRYDDHLNILFEYDVAEPQYFLQEFSLTKSHFFALTSGEQLECLIAFIKEKYSEYNKHITRVKATNSKQ